MLHATGRQEPLGDLPGGHGRGFLSEDGQGIPVPFVSVLRIGPDRLDGRQVFVRAEHADDGGEMGQVRVRVRIANSLQSEGLAVLSAQGVKRVCVFHLSPHSMRAASYPVASVAF